MGAQGILGSLGTWAQGKGTWAPWAGPRPGPRAAAAGSRARSRDPGPGPGSGPKGPIPCAFALALALALAKDPLAAPVAMNFHKKGIDIT